MEFEIFQMFLIFFEFIGQAVVVLPVEVYLFRIAVHIQLSGNFGDEDAVRFGLLQNLLVFWVFLHGRFFIAFPHLVVEPFLAAFESDVLFSLFVQPFLAFMLQIVHIFVENVDIVHSVWLIFGGPPEADVLLRCFRLFFEVRVLWVDESLRVVISFWRFKSLHRYTEFANPASRPLLRNLSVNIVGAWSWCGILDILHRIFQTVFLQSSLHCLFPALHLHTAVAAVMFRRFRPGYLRGIYLHPLYFVDCCRLNLEFLVGAQRHTNSVGGVLEGESFVDLDLSVLVEEFDCELLVAALAVAVENVFQLTQVLLKTGSVFDEGCLAVVASAGVFLRRYCGLLVSLVQHLLDAHVSPLVAGVGISFALAIALNQQVVAWIAVFLRG